VGYGGTFEALGGTYVVAFAANSGAFVSDARTLLVSSTMFLWMKWLVT
jgi:hypothetical protein